MTKRFTRTKLIFNPASGAMAESPVQLIDLIGAMQGMRLLPEVYLTESNGDLAEVIHDALRRGIRMFVVCGGDGTIEKVAFQLAGIHATLGIIPTGIRNNIAHSLGIPINIQSAAGLLRKGDRIKVDVGTAKCGDNFHLFLEVCSVGLISAIYPSADDFQHGKLSRIGDIMATIISSPPADIYLLLDGEQEVNTRGHGVLAANMPYFGPNYLIAPEASIEDGLLDLLVLSDLSKLDILGQVVEGRPGDPRIQQYRVRTAEIHTQPPMPVMVDEVSLGNAPLTIGVRHHDLTVMAGELFTEKKGAKTRRNAESTSSNPTDAPPDKEVTVEPKSAES